MKVFLLLTFLIFSNLFAQNLVPNPSFEEYTTCPYLYDENGQYNDSRINQCRYWSGTNISSDYYNSCANINDPECGVPTSSGQFPKSGQAMAGIALMNSYGSNCREYLQTKFNLPLIQGITYHLKYFVIPNKQLKFLINNIGAYFSVNDFSTPFCLNGVEFSQFTDNVVNFENKVVNDVQNWTKIEGIYVAQGG